MTTFPESYGDLSTIAMPLCEVCRKNKSIGVASLPFGPYSCAFCSECISQNAYPLWTIFYLYEDVGNCNDDALIPEVKEFKTYFKGEYLTWEQMKSLHAKYKEWMKNTGKTFLEEFETSL